MRLRVAFQSILTQLTGALVVGAAGLSSGLWADEVYLKKNAQPIHGRVVTEKEDTFVVEIPKEQIQRIERSTPLPGARDTASDTVLWEETGDVIVLTVPRSLLHVVQKGRVDSSPVVQVPAAGSTAGRHLGGVTGHVLWDGQPAVDCHVKVVQVSRMDLGVAARLLGRSETEARESIARETVTDATGRYHIENLVPGEYDVYWKPRGEASWIRRLSERPDLLVLTDETTPYPNIKAHVQTVN